MGKIDIEKMDVKQLIELTKNDLSKFDKETQNILKMKQKLSHHSHNTDY